jgi:hypothetical protein
MSKKTSRRSIATSPLFLFFILLVVISSISSIVLLSRHHAQKEQKKPDDVPRRSQGSQEQLRNAMANSTRVSSTADATQVRTAQAVSDGVASNAQLGSQSLGKSEPESSSMSGSETGADVKAAKDVATSKPHSDGEGKHSKKRHHNAAHANPGGDEDEEDSDGSVGKQRHRGKTSKHSSRDSDEESAGADEEADSSEKETRKKGGSKQHHKHRHHHEKHGKKEASESESESEDTQSMPTAESSSNGYVDVKLGDVTIVTAYYRIESKHSDEEYDHWIANMMSITDPMIIFTSEDLAPNLKRQRAHSKDLTKIVIQPLSDSLMGTNFTREFWNGEFKKDPEAFRHKSVELYWIWNEKPNWLRQAAEMNPFHSSFFAWVDIGYLRESKNKYKGKQMIRRLPSTIKDHEVMLLNVNTFKIKDMDPNILLHDNRVGGNFIAGRSEGVHEWYKHYYAVMWKFIEGGFFVGKDQHMMASVCAQRGPKLCYLIAPTHPSKKLDRVTKWFIILPALHGDIPLVRAWFPAPPSPAVNKEEGPVVLEELAKDIDEVDFTVCVCVFVCVYVCVRVVVCLWVFA